jgi:hypothetical protein
MQLQQCAAFVLLGNCKAAELGSAAAAVLLLFYSCCSFGSMLTT